MPVVVRGGHPNAVIDRWDDVDVRDSGPVQATMWCEIPVGVAREDDEPVKVVLKRFAGWYHSEGVEIEPAYLWVGGDYLALTADAADELADLLRSGARKARETAIASES